MAGIAAGPSLGELPTLWIHGEQDPLAPLAETRAAFERVGALRPVHDKWFVAYTESGRAVNGWIWIARGE